jgi:hypothetical protein
MVSGGEELGGGAPKVIAVKDYEAWRPQLLGPGGWLEQAWRIVDRHVHKVYVNC